MLALTLTIAEAELVLRALLAFQRYHNGAVRCAAADLAERLEGLMQGVERVAIVESKVAGYETTGTGA